MANKDKAALQKQLQGNNAEYGQYGPQFGDLANWGIKQGYQNASSLYDPSWGYQSQQHGMDDANAARASQERLDAQAGRYEQMSEDYRHQLEPGLAQQDAQADWMWQNPGYTGGEKLAMNQAAQSPIAGAYAQAGGDMRHNAAITGNSAGLGAGTAELARSKARDMSMAGINNQALFGDKRIEGTKAAVDARSGANETRRQSQATGADIFTAGQNMRLGEAGSHLQSQQGEQAQQGLQQSAVNLGMEPGRIASGMYGNVVSGRNATYAPGTSLSQQSGTSFLKQLALAGVSGGADVASTMIGKPKGK